MHTALKDILTQARQKAHFTLKEVMVQTDIDTALLSKFEKGRRIPTDDQIQQLAQCYKIPFADLKKQQLAERIFDVLKDEHFAYEALLLTEPRIQYMMQKKLQDQFCISATTEDLIAELDELKHQYIKLLKEDDLHQSKVDEQYNLAYTYESNKIEGNTLTLSETMLVIKEGITISGKSVQEHLEAINHTEAIELMFDFVKQKIHFRPSVLLDFHSLILRGIRTEDAGRYRSVPVQITGSKHRPPEAFLVPKLMEDYFLFYETYRNKIHPVVLAAEMHERLVTIHPFVDGNGRTSRLVMNFILSMHGYPIAILKGDATARLEYFRVLEAVQVEGNPEPFHQLVIQNLIQNVKERIHFMKAC
jgi:Fic family protein